MIAVLIGDEEMSALLIKKKADIEAKDNEGNTALMMAATKENIKVVELLLGNGADLNARNNSGNTALALAKSSGVYRTQVVRRLLNTQAHAKVAITKTMPNTSSGSIYSRSPST